MAGAKAVLPRFVPSCGHARRLQRAQKKVAMADNVFDGVPEAPPDPILSLTERYREDDHPDKLNLGVGAYRTEEGMPYVLGCVKSAEVAIMEAQNEGKENKEYLPIEGSAGFNNAAATLALGSDDEALGSGRVTTVQALSGTGALTVGAHFLRQHYSVHKVLVPSPTWGNHNKVFPAAGLHVEPYPYFDYDTNGLDLDGMLSALRKAEEGSIVLLHACAHNPTGVDPSEDQWRQILQTVRERKLLPFFDVAYQGFASGDLDRDAFSLRLFASCGIEMLFAQSFAKNMGLYGERVGALSVVTSSPDSAHRVKTQLKSTIRPMYSSPPVHGASIARYVLSDPELFALWQHEMSQMAERIASVRRCLSDALRANDCPGDWSHILQQIGMFSFTGLTKQQVERMTWRWHIYMTSDGRISLAGLSHERCAYLADAIKDAVTNA